MSVPPSLLDARSALDAGLTTASELLEKLLTRLHDFEPSIRALVTPTLELAREQAAKADVRLAAGEREPLLGIPIVVKDLIDVAGLPTRAGSRVLEANVPVTSSVVWTRLEAAGAVLLGKANTHEFAYGGTTEPTRNPADTSRIVGGSSGGPAAALAAGYCLGAVGTDTAGSIRIPANLCGVAGLKPTRGTVPADGVVPLSTRLDAVGPMARSVADLAPLLQVLAAADPSARDTSRKPRRVGVLTDTGPQSDSVGRAVRAATDAFRSLDVSVVDVELPGFAESLMHNFTIIGFEASRYHQQWADRRALYTPYVRDRLAAATEVTSGQYDAAVAAAAELTTELDRILDQVDVVLLPGVPFPAPPAYDEQVLVAGEWCDRDSGLCRNTAFANLTGHPALAIPAGLDDGLPVGIQLVGRPHSDFDLVALGAQLEKLLPPGLPQGLRAE